MSSNNDPTTPLLSSHRQTPDAKSNKHSKSDTMAANAKYQPAPQEEPADDYTQAPPAYAAGSSSRDEEQGLFGAPRSSEDNLPDDFKVCETLC